MRPRTLRVALVHKMPTPYRVPVFDRIAATPGIDLTVVYSSEREPNRHWDRPEGRARAVFLKEHILNLGENKYLTQHASTLSYDVTITVNDDGSWSYDEKTMLKMDEFPQPFTHTDRNTLRKAG